MLRGASVASTRRVSCTVFCAAAGAIRVMAVRIRTVMMRAVFIVSLVNSGAEFCGKGLCYLFGSAGGDSKIGVEKECLQRADTDSISDADSSSRQPAQID